MILNNSDSEGITAAVIFGFFFRNLNEKNWIIKNLIVWNLISVDIPDIPEVSLEDAVKTLSKSFIVVDTKNSLYYKCNKSVMC